MVGTTVSHYKILEHLGGGGMGVVYKAEDTKLKRTVALKFLPPDLTRDPEAKERFVHEAQAASALQHNNICNVHDIDESPDGQLFIVMDLYEGETLKKKIERGPLPVDQVVDIALQVAQGLSRAHEVGIIHRDIKPANIMVTNRGEVKIVDFGLAKLSGRTLLTKTGSTMGTAAYMSPEQARSEAVDARTDIWSLGVVLYEMLTGRRPFESNYEQALVYSILNEEPKVIREIRPDVSETLEKITRRAMAKELKDRYQGAAELIGDLESYKAGTQLSKGTRNLPNKKRRALYVGAAALLVLCAICVLLLLPRAPAVRLNPNRTSNMLRIPFNDLSLPSVSRDGNWLAFAGKDEAGRYDVYWMSVTLKTLSPVTKERYLYVESVDLSPDASQIVYDCRTEQDTVCRVRLVPSLGGPSQTLSDTGYGPKWRPDGQRIAYMRVPNSGFPSASGKFEIWSLKSDGLDSRLEFIDSLHVHPQRVSFCWSPDGGSIAWVRNFSSTRGEVMVRELATGRERQLTFDGKEIDEVFWATNDQILFVSTTSGPSNLWMIPASGGEASQITPGGSSIMGGRLSADNKTLIYLQREYLGHLWISSVDGSNARQVTFADDLLLDVSFSPDRKHITSVLQDVDYFTAESHLYTMDADGRNRRQLTSGPERVLRSRWSPNGKWLAYSTLVPGEPDDSCKIYLMQPFNPGPTRLLCKSATFAWVDSDKVAVYDGVKTLLYSVNGGIATQVFQDSTFAIPVQGNKQLLFRDDRAGRKGWWIVSVDALGKQTGEAKRILPSGVAPVVPPLAPPDWRFLLYRKQGDEVWRVWTLTGKEERIGRALPGAGMRGVSMDGEEILWITGDRRAKLVLVKNMFE